MSDALSRRVDGLMREALLCIEAAERAGVAVDQAPRAGVGWRPDAVALAVVAAALQPIGDEMTEPCCPQCVPAIVRGARGFHCLGTADMACGLHDRRADLAAVRAPRFWRLTADELRAIYSMLDPDEQARCKSEPVSLVLADLIADRGALAAEVDRVRLSARQVGMPVGRFFGFLGRNFEPHYRIARTYAGPAVAAFIAFRFVLADVRVEAAPKLGGKRLRP